MLKIVKLLLFCISWLLFSKSSLASTPLNEPVKRAAHGAKSKVTPISTKKKTTVWAKKAPVRVSTWKKPTKTTVSKANLKKTVSKKAVSKKITPVRTVALHSVKKPIIRPTKYTGSSYHPKVEGIRTVVIDAGHGGKDPGALGKTGVREKGVVLAIALSLARQIKEAFPDVKVILTRKTDVFVELHERSAIANRNRADLFISIHANSLPTRRDYSGTETYAMGLHKSEQNLAVAKRENAVILQEENYQRSYKGFDPSSPIAHIMLANFQSAYMGSSLNLASKIERQFNKTDRTSRGVKQAGFLVLWETAMPSVLVETGYLSNGAEEEFLNSEDGQNQLAKAIFKAFEQYKTEREKPE